LVVRKFRAASLVGNNLDWRILSADQVGAHFLRRLIRGSVCVAGSIYGDRLSVREPRNLRRLSYAIDTTLLAAALLLASIIHQWPFVQPWLTTKVLLMLAYIALGLIALRLGKTRPVRLACFVAALIVYSFIISVALTHDSRGFLALTSKL